MVLKFKKDLNIPDEKLNVNGGAIAMGHPLGATGAMIIGTWSTSSSAATGAARWPRCASAAAWASRPSSSGFESMAENMIEWDKDDDGIVTLTMDDPTGSANTMNEQYSASLHDAVERLEAEKE